VWEEYMNFLLEVINHVTSVSEILIIHRTMEEGGIEEFLLLSKVLRNIGLLLGRLHMILILCSFQKGHTTEWNVASLYSIPQLLILC
jgi:hypothetical protein